MPRPIALCANSTCDLSEELVKKYNIHIMPLHVNLDGKTYLDGVDIQPDEIYAIYHDKGVLPTTAAVNMAEYEDVVRPLIDAGNDVVCITLGSGLSATYNNCRMTAEEIDGMYAVDSGNLSTGMGHVVLAAAKYIEEGLSVEEVVEKTREFKSRVEASFVVDTLEFLHKGGRCSALAMMGANVLKLRPCIEVNNEDGTMSVGKKYRGTMDKVLAEYVKDRLEGRDDICTDCLFITHSGMPDERVALVREAVEKYMHFDEIHVTRAGCTISSHCGPGTLGILLVRK